MTGKSGSGPRTEDLDDTIQVDAPPVRATSIPATLGSSPSAPATDGAGVGSAEAELGAPGRGDTIGRFVVLGVLGSGGMGFVYSAYDPHLDRKVAIKLLRASVTAEHGLDARTRLLREAQAMAKINHPNVVKVHEVGMYNDQVYVAMEFADGGTLREWMRQPRARRAVIDVFAAAGRGLAAAHAAGLVHRDFKPDNVLMSADGNVRVTDFGLVAAVHDTPAADLSAAMPTVPSRPPPDAVTRQLTSSSQQQTPLDAHLTKTGAVMGTPTYMAPEQYAGRPSTARTDQFSFCVALYEALYGERPFAGDNYMTLGTAVMMGEVRPPPRGPRVPGWMRRALLRGLQVEQANRFPSMGELLAIVARDPNAGRRRALAIGGGAAAVVAVIAVLALRPARDRACKLGTDRTDAAWNAQREAAIGTAFAASGRPLQAQTFAKITAGLDHWIADWNTAYVDACEATRVRGEQSEHLLDLRMHCLTRRLDDASATITALASGGPDTVDHAIDAVTSLPAPATCGDTNALLAAVPPPDNAMARAQVARVRQALDSARGESRLARYAKARPMLFDAVANARLIGYHPALGEALYELGRVQLELMQLAAVDTLREAMHVAAAAGDTTTELDAATQLTLALIRPAAKYELAREVAEFADAIAAAAHPPPPTAIKLEDVIALELMERGHPAEARKRYEHALALAETLPPDSQELLTTLNQLGNLDKQDGHYDDARAHLQRVLDADERVFGKNHPYTASTLNNLGNVERAADKLPAAKALYERALAIRIAALGKDNPEVADSYNNLATYDEEAGDIPAAKTALETALAIETKAFGPDSVENADALANLGNITRELGDLPGARAHLERALKLYTAAYGDNHVKVASTWSNLGLVADREKKYDEALADYRKAIAITEHIYGPDSTDVAEYLINVETILHRQKKFDDAEAALQRAITILGTSAANQMPLAMALTNLAGLQRERDNAAAALPTYQRSRALIEAAVGADHPYTAYPLIGEGWALTQLGRSAEALPLLEHAVAIRSGPNIQPDDTGEAQFEYAKALAAAHQRAKALDLAKQAAANYDRAKADDNAAEVRSWIAGHR